MIHMSDCKPCAYCRSREKARARSIANKRRKFKGYLIAKRDAIKSGKVKILWQVDEVTGIHYRINKHGQYVEGGRHAC